MEYNKLPKTHDEQLDLLISRGLTVNDRSFALHCLRKVNYYRLTAYRFPLVKATNPDCFIDGTTFYDMWQHYDFDRKLRILFLDAIEKIEVALRSSWACKLSTNHGSHAYTNSSLFKSGVEHTKMLSKLDSDIGRSKEPFVKHYKKKYTNPERPPIWAVCELMTLGQLSRFCDCLAANRDQQAIANNFGLKQQSLGSYLHALTFIRNICAHHARLWNKCVTITCQKPRKWKKRFDDAWNCDPKKERNIYNIIVLTLYIMDELVPDNLWGKHLIELINRYPVVSSAEMGFPVDWQELDVWARCIDDMSTKLEVEGI